MKISREDVLRVAELAYLDLGEAELEMYRAQIDEILEYIGKLNELDTSKVEPMAQVLSDDQTADATLREDLIVPCAVAEDVLKHAPDPEPPYFRVPKVIEIPTEPDVGPVSSVGSSHSALTSGEDNEEA